MRASFQAIPQPPEDILERTADAVKGGVRVWLLGTNVDLLARKEFSLGPPYLLSSSDSPCSEPSSSILRRTSFTSSTRSQTSRLTQIGAVC